MSWRLLVQKGRRVGYAKEVGELTLYSREGKSFSGGAIPHELALEALPVRTLGGERVFVGDVVELRERPGGDFVERALLLDDSGAVRLGYPRSTRVEPIPSEWSSPSAVPVRKRLGSIHVEPYYRRRYAAAAGSVDDHASVSVPALGIAAAALTTGLAAAWVQIALLGSAGPLVTLAGAAVGIAGALGLEAKRGARLRHRFLLRLAVRTGLLCGLALAAGHRVWLEESPWGASLAAGGFGFLASFALVAMLSSGLEHYVLERRALAEDREE